MGENIKVAVRVRPFSEREKSRNANLIVQMESNTTILVDPNHPKAEPRKFTFDHSYWSHDGYSMREKDGYLEPASPKYTDQQKVFDDLGRGMLKNAWAGYNCSIFAYGQTGSGKSYSIMGYGSNKGLVPMLCHELFDEISRQKRPGVEYQVTLSMLEIYNEHVRDLLSKTKTPPTGMNIRQSPQRGFYVENLTKVPVGSYKDVELRMSEGNRKRTVAATKMNETSSRAHTIVTIQFAQNSLKEKTTKHSHVNLVDLAGSERAKQTEATGDRFEESKNINKSLMTLGNVIKGLCDKAMKKRSGAIPYRDSVLTKLLMNALQGNSKTTMIAAISPDAENYDQTLSTLKYADRAKSIKTVAQINETATDKLIKDLIAEKERLLQELQNSKAGGLLSGYSEGDIQKMKQEQQDEIDRYREEMKDVQKSWEKRLAEAQHELQRMQAEERKDKEDKAKTPYLWNLNEDPALTAKIIHFTRTGNSIVGNGKDGNLPQILINGPSIAKEHAIVANSKGDVSIKPDKGRVLHNGKEISEETKLNHQDRIVFGSNNLFVFHHPKEEQRLKGQGRKLPQITFEDAQNELAKHSGLNFDSGDSALQEAVLSVMPLVSGANDMAEDIQKPVKFEIVLVSAEARGLEDGRTEVFVKVTDQENGNEYLWERNKFLNRQVLMQELYQVYEEAQGDVNVEKEKDPFWEPPDTPVLVGVVTVPLNYLAHMVDFQDEPLTIIDYRAKQIGFLKVDVVPCDAKGHESDDMCVEEAVDLIGQTLKFKIKIHQAMNLPSRYIKTWCHFRFYQDSEVSKTDRSTGANPKFNFEKLISVPKRSVDHKFIAYLLESSLPVELWGHQGEKASLGGTFGGTLMSREDKDRLQSEITQWQRNCESLQKKLDKVKAVAKKAPKSAEMKEIQRILDS